MLFLLHMQTRIPEDMPAPQRQALTAQERDHAVELMRRGVLRRIYRVVGDTANFSIWDVPDRATLDAELQALPTAAYKQVVVTAIEAHPVEQHYQLRYGAAPDA